MSNHYYSSFGHSCSRPLGAGLYSFFQNYSQACLATRDCQQQIVDVDPSSEVHIYSLATVSSAFQISVSEKGVVKDSNNNNGFASTVTLWEQGALQVQPDSHEHYCGDGHLEVEVEVDV